MIVEVCKTDDKNSDYYIRLNKAAGHEVFEGRLYPKNPQRFYYVVVYTDTIKTPEFKKIPSGTYTLVKNDANEVKAVYHG